MMTKNKVLLDILNESSDWIKHLLETLDEECLHWSPDGHANSIAVTIWHAARIFDVFLTQYIAGMEPSEELWQTSGWSEKVGYDPRGIGTNGWGAVTGYSEKDVKEIPNMDADTLKGYFCETVEKIDSYLKDVSDQELNAASKGYEGKETNYFWVRHSIFHVTLHLGEILAIEGMWKRQIKEN